MALPFVPFLLKGLATLFSSRLGHWIVSALLFLGLSWGTQQALMEPLMAYVSNAMSGLPADGVAWLGFFNIDRAVSILFSAYAVRTASRLVMRRRVPASAPAP